MLRRLKAWLRERSVSAFERALERAKERREGEPILRYLRRFRLVSDRMRVLRSLNELDPHWPRVPVAEQYMADVAQTLAAMGGHGSEDEEAMRACGELIVVLAEASTPVAQDQLYASATNANAPEVRLEAAMALHRNGDDRAADAVRSILASSGSWAVAAECIEALGEMGTDQARDVLLLLLTDTSASWATFDRAIATLSRNFTGWRDSEACQVLVHRLIDSLKSARQPRVRANAATVLGAIRDPRAVGPLIEALRDDDGYRLGDDTGAPRDGDPFYRVNEFAAQSLREITNENFGLNQLAWRKWYKGR